MKKLKYLILVLLLFIGIKSVKAFDNTIKVYDYAQVLTEKEESKLKKDVDKFISKYNIDMAIVTVKYYNQETLNEYMNLFYIKNDFGIGTNKDGIIAVLDFKNNQNVVGIETFGNVNNYYSELEIKSIINDIQKEKNNYNKLEIFVDGAFNYVDKFEDNYSDNNILLLLNWVQVITLSILISTIIVIIGIFKNKNVRKEESARYYIKENSVVITKRNEKYITTNTKKERINK